MWYTVIWSRRTCALTQIRRYESIFNILNLCTFKYFTMTKTLKRTKKKRNCKDPNTDCTRPVCFHLHHRVFTGNSPIGWLTTKQPLYKMEGGWCADLFPTITESNHWNSQELHFKFLVGPLSALYPHSPMLRQVPLGNAGTGRNPYWSGNGLKFRRTTVVTTGSCNIWRCADQPQKKGQHPQLFSFGTRTYCIKRQALGWAWMHQNCGLRSQQHLPGESACLMELGKQPSKIDRTAHLPVDFDVFFKQYKII